MTRPNGHSFLHSLESKLEIESSNAFPLQSSNIIYRVSEQLRRVDHVSYTPTMLSIGPYHYGDANLEPMQNFKFWYFKKFLKRVPGTNPYGALLGIVRENEEKIRGCYSENILMHSNNFVKLITLDASFIIEYLISNYFESESNQPNVKPGMDNYLMLDMVRLENQIPYFVLKLFFEKSDKVKGMHLSYNVLLQLPFVKEFLSHIYPEQNAIKNKWKTQNIGTFEGDPCHFCDLLRKFYMATKPNQTFGISTKRSYGVYKLKLAGFRFHADHTASIIELKRVEGREGIIIPSLKMTCWSETLLRNVIAFELCRCPYESFVTEYIMLLDSLINTEKGVEVLVEKGIMINTLNNDKVVDTVHSLCDQVNATLYSNCYGDLHEMLDDFYDRRYLRHKATFVQEYWSTPWKRISLGVGTLIVIIYLIQTICAVMSLTKT